MDPTLDFFLAVIFARPLEASILADFCNSFNWYPLSVADNFSYDQKHGCVDGLVDDQWSVRWVAVKHVATA